MKYIDADKLLVEIARLRKEHTTREYRDEAALVLEDLEDYVVSLQQEQPEVNLENEIERVVEKHKSLSSGRKVMKPSGIEKIARHFYKLGLNARKEDDK